LERNRIVTYSLDDVAYVAGKANPSNAPKRKNSRFPSKSAILLKKVCCKRQTDGRRHSGEFTFAKNITRAFTLESAGNTRRPTVCCSSTTGQQLRQWHTQPINRQSHATNRTSSGCLGGNYYSFISSSLFCEESL